VTLYEDARGSNLRIALAILYAVHPYDYAVILTTNTVIELNFRQQVINIFF